MEVEISCPYCGEINIIEVDQSGGRSQTFVQDCEVCCRPIELIVNIDRDGIVNIQVNNEEGSNN